MKNEILNFNNSNKENSDNKIKKNDGVGIVNNEVNQIKNDKKISFPPKKMKKKNN